MVRDVGTDQISDVVDKFARVALVARALTGAIDVSEVVDIVVRQGMAGLGADGGVLAVVDARNVLAPVATVGYAQESIAAVGPLHLDRELPITTAVRENEPVWVSSRADGFARFPALLEASTASQAWVAVPLVANGTVVGALGISFLALGSSAKTNARSSVRSQIWPR